VEEYISVKQSIIENGQYYPIIVNQDGIVLDGHHRFKICTELGTKPLFTVRKFKDVLDEKLFVIKSNLERRHLNNFQRIELALKSKPFIEEKAKRNESLGGKGKGKDVKYLTPLRRANQKVGELAGVSHETVRKVEKLIESLSDHELDIVRKGEISINQAYHAVLLTKIRAEIQEKLRSEIQTYRPEMDNINDELIRLERLLTESKDSLSTQQRQQYRMMYENKLQEYEKKCFNLELIIHKALFRIISLVTGNPDLEKSAINGLRGIEWLENLLPDKEGTVEDQR
jgi:ParB-like chromosome segregation protein Spo0J